MHPEITSAGNPRVKELLALRRRRTRDRSALTRVEGYAELLMARGAGVRPYLVVCKKAEALINTRSAKGRDEDGPGLSPARCDHCGYPA